MKELIEQLRKYDSRIDQELANALEQQAKKIEELSAALAVKDEALKAAAAFVPESYLQKSIIPAALSLQPHASVVAKIKAEAVKAFAKWYGIAGEADEYAERLGSLDAAIAEEKAE